MYSDRQVLAKSVDPDETPQYAASHQDLQFATRPAIFKHKNGLWIVLVQRLKLYKYGKELRCLNT